jgi:hypothetical protein
MNWFDEVAMIVIAVCTAVVVASAVRLFVAWDAVLLAAVQ